MATTVESLFDQTTKRTVSASGKVSRVHNSKYRLKSDDMLSTFAAAEAFSLETGIVEFDSFDGDALATCRAITAKMETRRAPWTYLVDVEWSTETPDKDQPNRELDDPFAEPVEIETDGELVSLPLFKDRDDKLIANTVGDPIGGLEQEENIEIVRITRNEPRRDSNRDRQLRNKLNENAFSGAQPGEVKLRSIRCRRQFRGRIEYWVYTYEFAYKKGGWQPSLLNAGLYKLAYDSAMNLVRVPCTDQYGEPVSEQVPLDANSNQIDPEDLPDDAHFLDFNTKEEADFDVLGLPV